MLTDIVFWCLLLPFMTGENFKLTLVSHLRFEMLHYTRYVMLVIFVWMTTMLLFPNIFVLILQH